MNYLNERVAYIKGLAEGMQLSETTNEGKLLRAIIEVLDYVALAIDDIEEVQVQVIEQIDSIDEDLAEVEEYIFDEDNDYYGWDDEGEDELECPYCEEIFSLDEAAFNAENTALTCPHCKKEIEVEWECDCEDCEDHR